ncbi:MAG: hypothetical protein A3K60_00420 [Euryarchaeota archaeon RBG_19FT_COMBO_56_21]|nr:MAG: hypothetical protein A3K60_00420 [Euryarchaeota archaeon RBG_19FT_COMBO_56_21]
MDRLIFVKLNLQERWAMFEGVIAIAEFMNAYNSRDIVRLAKWLEQKHREVIAPLVKGNEVLRILEGPAGQAVGQKIGQYFTDQYEASSQEQREIWKSTRWLHHGALGELLIDRGKKKHKPFIAGLGRGLCMTDLQDQKEWHTHEYYLAQKRLEKMR